ncbi:AlwI family type II restriction endonuclease [Neobacillus niacini]|uniref:AlwI family type II restriction endonuclease n=1 Tax=Neobacillus niacini TaxID=86668 RepID=UPI0007ABABF0|nr:AlwI family type II restriction endonuclease [Neobacillus niacini]MEC1521286.1 AlwI family type II restriction endonuclease [Neobacillus niacini]
MVRDSVWSINTTLRSPDRLQGYIEIVRIMQGRTRDEEFEKDFFFETIRRGLYQPNSKDPVWKKRVSSFLPKEDFSYILSEEEVNDLMSTVFYKNKTYQDDQFKIYAFRGRTAFSPLTNFGFVRNRDEFGKVSLTPLGEAFSQGINTENMFLRMFLKWQLDNPTEINGFNIMPFVATVKVIAGVNQRAEKLGLRPVGISFDEMKMYIPTLVNAKNIAHTIEQIIDYRLKVKSMGGMDREEFKQSFFNDFTERVFNTKSEESLKTKKSNLRDYADSAIRYFRETGILYLRGGGRYIDISPSRTREAAFISEEFTAEADNFKNVDDYINYLSDTQTPDLPWETFSQLGIEYNNLYVKHERIQNAIAKIRPDAVRNSDYIEKFTDINRLADAVQSLRQLIRQSTRTLKMFKNDQFLKLKEISIAIEEMSGRTQSFRKFPEVQKPSVRLEWLFAESLVAIGNANFIKPNYNVGDDGIPLWTARGNVEDLLADYPDFQLVGEVTMMQGHDQWINEGQPVMRHVADLSKKSTKPTIGLFLAPSLHRDTINTFFGNVKYPIFEGQTLAIIPLTLKSYAKIINKIFEIRNVGSSFSQKDLWNLFSALHHIAVQQIDDSTQWIPTIDQYIDSFCNQ